jgi:hypothetical protein
VIGVRRTRVLPCDRYERGARAADQPSRFNAAVETQGLLPSRTPEEARGQGRYVLENDERVDVLVARTVPTVDGVRVAFDEVWSRRSALEVAPGVTLGVPTLDDLIPLAPPSAVALARLRALAERQLTPEEVRAALAQPLGAAEEEESRSLIRWFRRRYPTPAERLAYARRAYRRWLAAAPAVRS